MNLTSRILQFMPLQLLVELDKICKDVTISDNNTKVDKIVKALDRYDIDYSELGPGTNRFAIFIDGYVFKIAMDRLGVQDNWAEFSLTQELQPFVIKVYECNGLIIVTEYVTVISKDEFIKKKDEIRRILATISDRYLLGDVGTVSKNFMNWGYRDNGELTILDFAYVYRIQGEEMICEGKNKAGDVCKSFLNYDENFHGLVCPSCGKKYSFMDIRMKIDPQYEKMEVDMIKQVAEVVTKPRTATASVRHTVETKVHMTVNEIYNKGDDDTMSKYSKSRISDEEFDDLFNDALNSLKNEPVVVISEGELGEDKELIVSDIDKIDDTVESIDEFDNDTEVDVDVESDDDTEHELTIDDVFVRNTETDINDLVEQKMNEDEEDEIDNEDITIASEVSVDCNETLVDERIDENDSEQSRITIVENAGVEVESTVEDVDIIEETTTDEHNNKCVDHEEEVITETVEVEEPVEVSRNNEPTSSSFIQVMAPDDTTTSGMRNELREAIPEYEEDEDDYDDQYDALYNQNVRTNQNIKYNRKKSRNE